MSKIGSYSFRSDGVVLRRLSHSGRYGGRQEHWYVVDVDPVTMKATVGWYDQREVVQLKKSQLATALSGLRYRAERQRQRPLQPGSDEPPVNTAPGYNVRSDDGEGPVLAAGPYDNRDRAIEVASYLSTVAADQIWVTRDHLGSSESVWPLPSQ